jgi:hypothetical protein
VRTRPQPREAAAQVHMLRMAAALYLSSACARSERNDFVPKDFHRINRSRRNSRDAFLRERLRADLAGDHASPSEQTHP